MKLKFNVDAWYNGVLLYKAGEIHEVKEELGFANRWLKRGAEVVLETENKEVIIDPEAVVAEEPSHGKHKKSKKAPKHAYQEL